MQLLSLCPQAVVQSPIGSARLLHPQSFLSNTFTRSYTAQLSSPSYRLTNWKSCRLDRLVARSGRDYFVMSMATADQLSEAAAPPLSIETSVPGVQFIELEGKGMAATIADISEINLAPTEGASKFVRPQSMYFMQEARVRQFRPAVYASELAAAAGATDNATVSATVRETTNAEVPLECAFTYELCAGIVDKPGMPLASIAKEEVAEELGYEVAVEDMVEVTSCITSVGISGARQTVFYVEVDESKKVSTGGGNPLEGEAIDVVALPTKQLLSFVLDSSIQRPAGAMFAALWLKQHLQV
eukprot:jgi/Mesen1/4347/ME000022S03638